MCSSFSQKSSQYIQNVGGFDCYIDENTNVSQEELSDAKSVLEEKHREEERSRQALKSAEKTLSSRDVEEMAERVHQVRQNVLKLISKSKSKKSHICPIWG